MSGPIDFAGHTLARASLDCCVKCTICETQCPVAAVTPKFSGPKYVGPQAERYRNGLSVDHTLDYCSSCGTCTLVCPQGVKIAELNNQARAVMKQGNMPLRDRLITNTTLMGRAMTPVAPLANWALGQRPLRALVEGMVGIHRNAPMPQAHRRSLSTWLRTRQAPAGPFPRGPLVFFHGCAGKWFEVQSSIAAIEVLEFLGYQVIVPKQGCCGLAKQSNGLYDEATKELLNLCDQLRSAGKELPIVSNAGSCAGMLKHEAHDIMGVDDKRLKDVSSRTYEFSEFLLKLVDEGEFPVDKFRAVEAVLPYHQPCQVKGQFMGMPAVELMELIPGVKVKESGKACCGIAGTYGVKKEKYEVAQAVGKPLFDFVRETNPELAVCETETCRWQIRQGSGAKVVHPAQVLHYAFGLDEDLFDQSIQS